MRVLLACFLLLLPSAAQAEAPERVVSISGPVTEIIYALGAEDMLVGADTTSYYPTAAGELPKVGYQRALSAEGILSLKPDLVILTEEAGPPPVIRQLEATDTKLLLLKAGRSVDDILSNIEQIARALNYQEQGEQLSQRIEENRAALARVVQSAEQTPGVMVVHHRMGGSPMAAGQNTAADNIVRLAGGRNVVSDFDSFKPLTPEAAIVLAPDIIIVATPQLAQVDDKAALTTHPVLEQTPAGKKGHVYVMDALEVLGYGPRTVDTAMKLNQLYQQL